MSGAPRPTYTEMLNMAFRALAETVSLGYEPLLDLDDAHALAAVNGDWDENLATYLRTAVQF